MTTILSFQCFTIFQRVTFAKQKSDLVAKMDGTFVPREKPKTKFEKKAAPTKKVKTDVEATNQLNKAPKETKAAPKVSCNV